MVTTPPRKNKAPNILGDWDDVRFFLAVAKTGSFSAAATQLNTKQTTVGRRIQALERRLEEALGLRVGLLETGEGEKVSVMIEVGDFDQLDELVRKLTRK